MFVNLKNIMLFFSDGDIQGKLDFQLHFCFDPSAEHYSDLPTNECKEISRAFNLTQWGVLLESKFDITDGDICATDESKSNHPRGELKHRLILYLAFYHQ